MLGKCGQSENLPRTNQGTAVTKIGADEKCSRAIVSLALFKHGYFSFLLVMQSVSLHCCFIYLFSDTDVYLPIAQECQSYTNNKLNKVDL